MKKYYLLTTWYKSKKWDDARFHNEVTDMEPTEWILEYIKNYGPDGEEFYHLPVITNVHEISKEQYDEADGMW